MMKPYNSKGKHKTSINKNLTIKYLKWLGIIDRCYSKKGAYEGCRLYGSWMDFQNFGDWFDENYNSEKMKGWELDKDILIKGNHIYGPRTCCFVPKEINSLFKHNNRRRGKYPIGVVSIGKKFMSRITIDGERINIGRFDTTEKAFEEYKKLKEKNIKVVAENWKHLINKNVYNSMINWEVNIED